MLSAGVYKFADVESCSLLVVASEEFASSFKNLGLEAFHQGLVPTVVLFV